MMNEATEIEPYVVCRAVGGELECALWTLAEGQKALALFLTAESATAYLASAKLLAPWRILLPVKADLLEILRGCAAAGIDYAVLDPNESEAKRMFDIARIVQAAEAG